MWKTVAKLFMVIYSVVLVFSALWNMIINNESLLFTIVLIVIAMQPVIVIGLILGVLEELETVKSICYRIERANDNYKIANFSNDRSILSNVPSSDNVSFWTCKSCGAENLNKNIHCDNCGNHK